MKTTRVLVIDDEQIILDSIRKILEGGDYEVEVSLSGRQGLDWALKKQYDVVLTDIRMPDIGGMRL
jgi:CheY-like chemotaxis protein